MDLNINYEETRTTGTQITNKGQEFRELLNKIMNINNQLKDSWQGSDAMKYANAITEQSQYMYQLSDTIDELGQTVVRIAVAYEQVCQDNEGAINS